MIYSPTAVQDAFQIDLEPRKDERGFFARAVCSDEFASKGLNAAFVQTNYSQNVSKGTIRGLHLQKAPHSEVKLVRCLRGAIVDVVVDLRPESPTYLRHAMVELTQDNHRAFYIHEGCAHGFQTLEDDTHVLYNVTAPYTPAAEQGYRYDDPAFGLKWPLPVSSISEKDAGWPLLEKAA